MVIYNLCFNRTRMLACAAKQPNLLCGITPNFGIISGTAISSFSRTTIFGSGLPLSCIDKSLYRARCSSSNALHIFPKSAVIAIPFKCGFIWIALSFSWWQKIWKGVMMRGFSPAVATSRVAVISFFPSLSNCFEHLQKYLFSL